MPYLRTLSAFRDGVRKVAIAKGDHALKDILALSDKLRDDDLVPLGVALDDQEGKPCSRSLCAHHARATHNSFRLAQMEKRW